MRKHLRQKHLVASNIKYADYKFRVQRLDGHLRKYFCVLDNFQTVTTTLAPRKGFEDLFWDFQIDYNALRGPDVTQALAYWDSELGFSSFSNTFTNLDTLVAFAALPEKTDALYIVVETVMGLMAKINASAAQVSYVYKKCFKMNESCKPLDPLQTPESVTKYGKMLARFICAMIRRATNPDLYYNFPLIQETVDGTLSFHQTLQNCFDLNERQILVREFVIQVFSERAVQQESCAVYNFIRICSFQAGKALNLKNTTQPIAMLKFSIKGCLMLKMVELGTLDKEIYQIAWPDTARPFTFIHDASKLLTTCILNSASEIHISRLEPYVDGLDQWFSVDGIKIQLVGIKNCYMTAFDKCVDLFKELVPSLPAVDWGILAENDCASGELGYSVVSSMPDKSLSLSKEMIESLYQSNGALNLGSSIAVAAKIEKISHILAFLVCLGCGQPCRGSEIGKFKINPSYF